MEKNLSGLHYEAKGTGETVLLIHAFPLSKDMWNRQVEDLAQSYKVITVDLPGFGQSPVQPKISIAAYAQSAALLLDQLKIEGPVVVAGISMGGYTAFEFFRQFPTRVRALGFFSTRAAPDSPEQKRKRHELADIVRIKGLSVLTGAIAEKLFGDTSLKNNPELFKKIRHMILAGSSEGTANALLAMAERADSSDLLNKIHVPVLIAAGTEDKVIPVSDAEDMHQQMSGSELHILDNAGHLLNLEQPERFNEIFKTFLKKV